MNEQTWVNKSEWGPGPWQDEPDKINWTDGDTGLPCMIVRGPSGALCGYVAVTAEHRLHGVEYMDPKFEGLHAHGGITFTDRCQPNDDGHGICHVPEPGQPDDVWWIGFDCAHGYDVMPALERTMREAGMDSTNLRMEATEYWPASIYKTVSYVMNECRDLAAQLSQ